MNYIEARGASLKASREHNKELKSIEIHGHSESKPGSPKWLVQHNHVGGEKPDTYDFTDGHEMIRHVAEHSGVPAPGDDGRTE
jgi:hypothetical protein